MFGQRHRLEGTAPANRILVDGDRLLGGVSGRAQLMSDEGGAVTGIREVPSGELGGTMKCGTTSADDGDLTVCGWADHGSVALGMFPGRDVTEAANLLREIRETIQTRD